ncbi:MAG: DUF1192 domain-containing protein [Pseudomonadota bacterium]
MLDDDLPAKRPVGPSLGGSLAGISVGDLEAYIQRLEDEIRRVQAELDRHSAHRAAAEALFKPRGPQDEA